MREGNYEKLIASITNTEKTEKYSHTWCHQFIRTVMMKMKMCHIRGSETITPMCIWTMCMILGHTLWYLGNQKRNTCRFQQCLFGEEDGERGKIRHVLLCLKQ